MLRPYPSFDRPVPSGGYSWWYADAVSEDAEHAITLIAFIGSVFSPYYTRAKCHSDVDPLNYCSINVAISSKPGRRWCMTERGRESVVVTPEQLRVGPSSLSWVGQFDTLLSPVQSTLTFKINERGAPLPNRVLGQVRFSLPPLSQQQFALDESRHHYWWPVGACAAVEVELEKPNLRWTGEAYVDMNWGDRSMEQDIDYWSWSRMRRDNQTYINYDVFTGGHPSVESASRSIAISANSTGAISELTPPPLRKLPRSRWHMQRMVRSKSTHPAISSTVEDSPFYARSLVDIQIDNDCGTAVHESLSLSKFRNPVVQMMLPFRMPRRYWFK